MSAEVGLWAMLFIMATDVPVTLRDAEAYCTYVQEDAAAQADLLLWPRLQVTAGLLNGLDDDLPATALLRPRLMAGLHYSVSAALRGLTLRRRALADCQRYHASHQLRALVERTRDGTPREALRARLEVLEAALPRAEASLARLQAALDQAQVTMADVHAAEIRVDSLRADMTQTRQSLAAAEPVALQQSIAALLQARQQADAEVQRYQADMETFSGWDVSLRGGYDRIQGVRQRWPVYGSLTFSASLGLIAQPAAQHAAARARAQWRQEEVGGLHERVQYTRERLTAMLAAHTQRAADLQSFVARLTEQLLLVEKTPGEVARTLADALWFDGVRAEADRVYAQTHARALRDLLGEE